MPEYKIGRNDPCPCGSGKKYKNCCMNKAKSDRSTPPYQKLEEVHEQLVYKLLKYAQDLIGPNILFVAWEDFILGRNEDYSSETPYQPLFYPWMIYSWVPGQHDFLREEDAGNLTGLTIAGSYAVRYDHQLSLTERRLIDITVHQPYSFYEIIDCNQGISFKLKDIFLGTEIFVSEKSGTRFARQHEILFGQVIKYENVGTLMSTGIYFLPPLYKISIIELRTAMRKGNESLSLNDLFLWESEIRDLYFSLHKRVSSPPILTNTDGDPLVLHELYYEIDSPEAVFHQLKPLALDEDEEELLADAEYDRDGKLSKIEFPWLKRGNAQMKTWENTVLGHITLDKNQLTINVNSANRANLIKRKIRSLLGTLATYKETKINFIESAMDQAEKSKTAKAKIANDDLLEQPEVKAAIDEQLSRHWQGWIYNKIPALNNVAPIDAVKEPDGLEKVMALLTDIELNEQNAPPHMKQKKYIDETRKRLGI